MPEEVRKILENKLKSKTISIKDAEKLYKILPKKFREEFTIGMHGFDNNYWKKDEKGEYQLNQDKIKDAKMKILSNGLKFDENRGLLSTVSFNNDLSNYFSEGYYTAGGIIVALPKVLKNESGDEIFVGGPNEESITQHWDRNHQSTSLSEILLPEKGSLDSMFILGTYTKNDKGIEVSINQNHIAFNKGLVSDEFFKEKYNKLIKEGIHDNVVIEETIKQQQNYKLSLKQKVAKFLQKNNIFMNLSFVDKFVHQQLDVLPLPEKEKTLQNKQETQNFMDRITDKGKLRKLPPIQRMADQQKLEKMTEKMEKDQHYNENTGR